MNQKIKGSKGADGEEMTRRASAEQSANQLRQLGEKTELDIYDLPIPEAGEHVWKWYCDLSNRRQNGMSINPISEESIGWFFHNRRIQPEQWEINAITGIDAAYLKSAHEESKK